LFHSFDKNIFFITHENTYGNLSDQNENKKDSVPENYADFFTRIISNPLDTKEL